jgi:hypothetical protein
VRVAERIGLEPGVEGEKRRSKRRAAFSSPAAFPCSQNPSVLVLKRSCCPSRVVALFCAARSLLARP